MFRHRVRMIGPSGGVNEPAAAPSSQSSGVGVPLRQVLAATIASSSA
jgi:hypothetical protein